MAGLGRIEACNDPTADPADSTVSIHPKPYSRFEFEITVSSNRDGKKRDYGPYAPGMANYVGEWTRYLLEKGPKPNTGRSRLRKYPWQFWYHENEVTRLDYDRPWFASVAALIGGFVVSGYSLGVGFLIIAAAVVALVLTSRRQKVIINAGRPVSEPRTLRLVDNWSTMANELGRYWEDVRRRLFERLSEGTAHKIQSRLENISYLTPDGKQERQQLVLTQGRGIVFCHVYPYGEDLYIGWDACLNYGQWVERTIANGYDAELNAPTTINSVVPGVARVTEYDLIDLNSLTEWVHSRVVRVVKRVMAEHKLDQEIDFKILRGERQGLLQDQEPKKRRPLFSRGAE